jgi:hypothetical protein
MLDEDLDGLVVEELVGMAEHPPCAPDAIGVAAQLAPMARVWHQLIIEHGPNPEGRCRGCTEGGTGEP